MSAEALSPGLALAGHLASLSLVAVGGINTVLPDIHRFVVEKHGWLSGEEFSAMVALGQAAPGPNFLVVALIGYRVSGWLGALGATLALCGPSSLLSYAVARLSGVRGAARWRRVIMLGLAPLTIGLLLASGYVIVRSADPGLLGYVIAVLTALAAVTTRVNPLWFLGAAGVSGALLL